MKRVVLNLTALAVIIGGGTFLASSAKAQDSIQSACGACSGVCCGMNADGSCWARDVGCLPPPPPPPAES